MKKFRYMLAAAALGGTLALASCGGQEKMADDEGKDEGKAKTETPARKPQEAVRPAEVTVMRLETSDFSHEVVSNGKLTAAEAADLSFRSPEIISYIYVRNGQRVHRGQPIAKLDVSRLENTLVQQKSALEQARLQMQDIVIGQGYDPEHPQSVPAEVMKLARVKSGMESAEASLKSTTLDIDAATLTAPIDGVVANLEAKCHNMAPTGEPFCRVIGTSAPDVEFTVLESELPLVAAGNGVEISTYSSPESVRGTVTAVNPMVDKNGMVKVWAKAASTPSNFVDGMNVRVRIKRSLPGQLVVPKTAVVLRSDRQVVFTLDGEGRAVWNYVKTGLENLTDYTITEGLEPGVTVITTGNINLAHESPVTVTESVE